MWVRSRTCAASRASEQIVPVIISARNRGLLALLLGAALLVVACSSPPETQPAGPTSSHDGLTQTAVNAVDPDRGEPAQISDSSGRERRLEPRGTPDGAQDSHREAGQARVVTVGPARKECYGPFRRMCLIVDGHFFYDGIDGFTHEPGYEYRLRIEQYDAFPGQQEPPQDAGRYGYRLLEVISKTRVSGDIIEAKIAPARVQCPKSDAVCLLVDGKPFRGAISGFDYEAGYHYRIRYERFPEGSHQLLDVMEQTPAQGTEEEIAVGPWRVYCYRDAPITAACIVVNGEPFYGQIEDFPRAHGYEYRLRVEKYDLMPDLAEPPAELPKYGYRLLEILSKETASSPPTSN